jgi:hypothetical protein
MRLVSLTLAVALAFSLLSGCTNSTSTPQEAPAPENSAKDQKLEKGGRPKPPK